MDESSEIKKFLDELETTELSQEQQALLVGSEGGGSGNNGWLSNCDTNNCSGGNCGNCSSGCGT